MRLELMSLIMTLTLYKSVAIYTINILCTEWCYHRPRQEVDHGFVEMGCVLPGGTTRPMGMFMFCLHSSWNITAWVYLM